MAVALELPCCESDPHRLSLELENALRLSLLAAAGMRLGCEGSSWRACCASLCDTTVKPARSMAEGRWKPRPMMEESCRSVHGALFQEMYPEMRESEKHKI